MHSMSAYVLKLHVHSTVYFLEETIENCDTFYNKSI